MSETKNHRHLAQAEIKVTNLDELFSASETIDLHAGDMINFNFHPSGNAPKKVCGTFLITEFRTHPDKNVSKENKLPTFKAMFENLDDFMDALLVKGDPGYLLFEDKEQIRVISHMLLSYDMANFTSYAHFDPLGVTKTKMKDILAKTFVEALIEIDEGEIKEDAYIGIEYIRS